MNRKLLIVLMAVIATFALVATGFAAHMTEGGFEYTPEIVKAKKSSINLSGSIRMRGYYYDDMDFSDAAANNDAKAQYDHRIRLKVDATVSPNTMGVLELETTNDPGNPQSADYVWGTSGALNKGAYDTGTSGNSKGTELNIRQAYIAHQGSGLLGVMSGMKVGHQLIKLGNGMFINHSDFGDDAIILWTTPADGMELSFTAAKFSENSGIGGAIGNSSDSDFYSLGISGTMDPVNYSADLSFLNDSVATDIDLWNLGIRGDMDLSGIKVSADFGIQFGEAQASETGGIGTPDVDFEGWAIVIGADTKISDFNAHAEFSYGSGDDMATPEYEGYVTSLASGQRSTFIADYRTTGAGTTITGGINCGQCGVNNAWYINVGGSMNATPDMKIAADLYYLGVSEEYMAPLFTDDDMGVELDAKVTYQIDNNLVWYAEGGILFAGDFYKNRTAGADVADPWGVRHGIILSF
jgi:hypothetical protein